MADTFKDFYISDDTLTDHSDSAVTGTLGWALGQIKSETTTAGRIRRIWVGSGSYDFASKLTIQDNIQLIGSGIDVTTFNFNDTTGGFIFSGGTMHTASVAATVGQYFFPDDGTDFPSQVRFRCTGAGSTGSLAVFSTACFANLAVGSTFTGGGTATFETLDFGKLSFGNFTCDMISTMTGIGISVERINGFTALDMSMEGGNQAGTALQVDGCNQYAVRNLNFEIASNGILINNTNQDTFPYNFGDAEYSSIDVTLTSTTTVGVKLIGSDDSARVINNILFSRMEIVGTGNVDHVQVGVWCENVRRNTFNHLDVEQCNVGIMEIGTSSPCNSNSFNRFQFQPNDGDQATEGFQYAEGVPFKNAPGSATLYCDVRSNWLNYSPFSDWPGGTGTYITVQDGGVSNRDVTAVTADSPVTGTSRLTLATSVPTAARTDFTRVPCVAPNSNRADGTTFDNTQTVDGAEGLLQAGGMFCLGKLTDSQHTPFLMVATTTQNEVAFRSVRTEATGLLLNVQAANDGPTFTPEAAADQVYIERLVPGAVLTSAPSTIAAGMIIRADGTSFNPGSGAGTYVRNAANSAWVLLG